MSFQVTKDTLTPELARLARACSKPQSVLQAMGHALVSMTKRAFNDQSLRPSPWAPLKDPSHAPLKKSGMLWQSIRVVELNDRFVIVGTDRPYAGYQQFGTKGPYKIAAKSKSLLHWVSAGKHFSKKEVTHPGIPPRPFFPFDVNGTMTPLGKEKIHAAAAAALNKLCGK